MPNGIASVPVTLDDNGIVTETIMVAGPLGLQAKSSGQILDTSRTYWSRSRADREAVESMTGLDTLKPVAGWLVHVQNKGVAKPDG